MATDFAEFSKYLRCPDDGAELRVAGASLNCLRCGRSFPRVGDRIIEMLPSEAAQLPAEVVNSRYGTDYRRFFHTPVQPDHDALAWGAAEVVDKRWENARLHHAQQVMAFLRKGDSSNSKTFCDFSGGAGYCTFAAAKEYPIVFHCDLSGGSLVYAGRKAAALGLKNIFFVRADYFAPPFRASVSQVVCLDTLIQGKWHEERLLATVRGALIHGGAAVADFHNWWHNPLRRIGLLPQNFPKEGSYTAAGLESLLASAGINDFQLQPFVQEITTNGRAARLMKRITPATRFLVRFSGAKLQPRRESFTHRATA
jgi:SAM-dependent methyltransferase